MKKTMLMLACMATLNYASAQRQGLWIAPQFSLGIGSMSSISDDDMESKIALNFNGGADVYYMFTNNIGAGVGLAYGAYATKWRDEGPIANTDFIAAQGTLDVPMFFRYTSGVRNGFFLQAGLIHSFTLAAEERIEIDGDLFTKETGSAAKNDFSSYSIYPFIFFGGNIACGNRVQLSVGPYFQFQANDNFKETSGLSGHYFIAGIKLGVGIFAFKPNRSSGK